MKSRKSQSISGVWTALVTPFDTHGKIDLAAFKKILKLQKDARVSGVIPCGTTGESPTLSLEEKHLLISTAVKEMKGSGVSVFAGTGTNDTNETASLSKWAMQNGADGLLVVTPYYNKPSQAGLIAHFETVAKASGGPIMLYQVPGRTGVRFTTETVCKLAKNLAITALKDASSDLPWVSELRGELQKQKTSDFSILCGDDPIYLPYLSVGAAGIVSVASNVIPEKLVAITNEPQIDALEIHQKYSPLFRNLFIETNPVPVKQALAWMGICKATVRLPLVEMSEQNQKILRATLNSCGIR